jgi:hypothetical protein
MEDEITSKDILEAINSFFNDVERRFESIDRRFDKIEAVMVTKDYLDEKLADLREDMVVLTRKEDMKLLTLIKILKEKNLISSDEEKRLLKMEPFPQLIL